MKTAPFKSTALALSICVSLSACSSMAPSYERPSAPVPAAWPTGSVYGQPATMPNTATAAADLPWQSFILDPRLRTVIDKALNNSRSLRETIASIESARAEYGVQRAALTPTVTAGVSGDKARSFTGYTNGSNATATTQSYSGNIGLSAYEVDFFGRVRSLSIAALETYLATEEASRSTRISLIAETATAWLTLAADESRLDISRKTLAAADRSMSLTRRRLASGIDTGVDVSSAETVYQQARADVASTATAIAQDRNALQLLVGAAIDDADLPQEMPPTSDWMADVPAGVSSDVLLRRPDVLQAEHQLKSANANIGAARAAFFPTLSLTAAGGVASAALSTLFSGGATVWSLAPALSVPIFDGGSNRSNLAYTKAQQQYYLSAYELATQTAFREVSDALAQRGTMLEQLSAQNALVKSANTSYVLADKRYQMGVDTYLTALVSQRTLYSAQLALVTTQLTALQNQVTLYKVLGGGAVSTARVAS